MKRLLVVLSIVLLAGASAFAQTNAKLGYINSAELLNLMPGADTVETKMNEHREALAKTIQMMYTEYQNKVQDYQSNVAAMSQIIRQTKEKEIQDLERRIQEFQQSADQSFQNKRAELLAPLLQRAKEAIDAVSADNGYTYIFDTSIGALLYFEKGDNILPLVKAKIGIE